MCEKLTRTKYVNIDTRFSGQFNCIPYSDYYIKLLEPIHNVKSVSISCIELPVTFFNICTAFDNNYFKIIQNPKSNSREIIVVLPDNNYSLDTLIKEINNQIKKCNINDLEFSMSSNIIDITSTRNNYVIDFAVDKNGGCDNNKWRLGWLLGFCNNVYFIEALAENVSARSGCVPFNILNPRYLYLEIKERDKRHNKVYHSFISSMLCPQFSKYIIARIAMDYKNFPYGETLTANLSNGLLISDTRHYKEKIKLDDIDVRLVNEFGFPINLNGTEISFCMSIECECSDK